MPCIPLPPGNIELRVNLTDQEYIYITSPNDLDLDGLSEAC